MKILVKVLLVIVINLYSVSTLIHCSNDNERKPYIVYMGELPEVSATTSIHEHHSLLTDVIGDEKLARVSKIHSYGRSLNGFVARLLPHEAKKLSETDSIVSVFPNTMRQLHTTRSWDFIGMTETVYKMNSKAESNIILGVLDTGIWVDAPSFNDEGYGPPPSTWKGKCIKGANFTGCNNKVIGAQYYNLHNAESKNLSPADTQGHGTHTSSTAAGEPIEGASLYGLAKGIARGGVPSARIAMYKVCWPRQGCSDMDILAAFDDAIADGVDIISVSIGGLSKKFFKDSIAIGAFHAMKKGILTSCSAGNSGPDEFTVENVAPWIMTVAASSIDRQFRTGVHLGNGMKTSGISINTFSPKKKTYPLINGARAANFSAPSYSDFSACERGTLSQDKVKGNIVFCLGGYGQDYTINKLGGAGTIISYADETDIASLFVIPATVVNAKDGKKIDQYINSTKNARAVIYKSTTVNIEAPFVASFSSRGPQMINRNILKPDIAAPGLDILAAYPKLKSITGVVGDNRFDVFNILSGTSMSCPHAAAAAAYVKTFHPSWSPAAIKSALMTTASPMKINQADAELGSGSGQINPIKAVNPGLVYDISVSSYIQFLCKEGYNSSTITKLTGGKHRYNCSNFRPALGADGLNYPSMHIQLKKSSSNISSVFYRTVTNVGNRNSVYKATVVSPMGLSVQVVPDTLSFKKMHEKKSFKVLLKGGYVQNGTRILSAMLEWNDSKHVVKTPILVYKRLV